MSFFAHICGNFSELHHIFSVNFTEISVNFTEFECDCISLEFSVDISVKFQWPISVGKSMDTVQTFH